MGGPHSGSAIRLTMVWSMICWMSSSRRIPTTPRRTVDVSLATRWAFSGSASQVPTRSGICADSTLADTTSGARKLFPTNELRLAPSWSFFRLMIAVCGTGIRSGCRNRAVTANQSASAPTMPASEAART